MTGRICYMGDTALEGAAAYLAGIMNHYALAYDYTSSAERPPADFCERDYALYILSDYPSENLTEAQMKHIVSRTRAGAGLLMLGGWESFHGLGGEYHKSAIADALPVVMAQADDRRNCAAPCLMRKVAAHPILEGLPFDTPAGIGGFNAFQAKPEARVLLRSVRFSVRENAGEFSFERGEEHPLLVVGAYGEGRVAAMATDVAPHWVGGFVDWGDARVTQAVGAGSIEVGNWYAEFFRNLLVWAGNLA